MKDALIQGTSKTSKGRVTTNNVYARTCVLCVPCEPRRKEKKDYLELLHVLKLLKRLYFLKPEKKNYAKRLRLFILSMLLMSSCTSRSVGGSVPLPKSMPSISPSSLRFAAVGLISPPAA